MVCVWLEKYLKIGMGVRKGTVVLFVLTLFGCFFEIPSLYVSSFFLIFFVTCFSCLLFFGGGQGYSIDPQYGSQTVDNI